MGDVLFALIAVPACSALVFMLIPSRYPQLVRYVALMSAGAMFVMSLIVFFAYQFDGGGGVVSQALFFLFFWYEVAVLPMYLLIAVWGASSDFGTFTRTKEYGAMKLVLYLVAGSVLIFIAIIATFVQADIGTFDLPALGEVNYDTDFQKAVFPLYMIGFGGLAGMG